MFGLLVFDRFDGVAVEAQDRRTWIAHDDRRVGGDDPLGRCRKPPSAVSAEQGMARDGNLILNLLLV